MLLQLLRPQAPFPHCFTWLNSCSAQEPPPRKPSLDSCFLYPLRALISGHHSLCPHLLAPSPDCGQEWAPLRLRPGASCCRLVLAWGCDFSPLALNHCGHWWCWIVCRIVCRPPPAAWVLPLPALGPEVSARVRSSPRPHTRQLGTAVGSEAVIERQLGAPMGCVGWTLYGRWGCSRWDGEEEGAGAHPRLCCWNLAAVGWLSDSGQRPCPLSLGFFLHQVVWGC